MTQAPVLIAGGGIGGLSLALTLHQIGVDCIVFESVRALKPLGVGINLQPNAVRELFDLGFTAEELDRFGTPAKEWALVGQKGQEIYSEPRGTLAGYKWPQYAVHRGTFHMALYHRFVELAGAKAVRTGCRATAYEKNDDGTVTLVLQGPDGELRETGSLLIGADGIHSAIRAQMHPEQPPIHWGGAVMWRGTTLAKPVRTGSSFIGLGTHAHRMVIYPISKPDPESGLAMVNWIAEVTYDDPSAHETMGWFRQVKIDDFIHHFQDWTYDWLDVPALIRGADAAYENPMIDRDPVPTWVDGPVALMGDAAHAMYPTGSNGASQAIIDARTIGAKMLKHGVTSDALHAYNDELCAPVSDLILRNRGAGPFGLLNLVNDRCGGEFDQIDDVIPEQERRDFMGKYQAAAGFARDTLNKAPRTIAAGARV
ncbi:FAD-dependent urate hydroxylase [Pelagimonas phthalicica]|uniref:FAD-dependent urate hydroxylase n=1 Tax=Pelagimonas phthalicica TaxID=1037362 RepID=A0A238J8B6_9RHOB|nr:flavin-dependent oxidoreductase [Pelagimonas phthalicica]TDS94878.1 2-polyprenyl-6-methoxyphenol hydroxylase-like FAD-dependent oxidoreductase [Pelagimonas phthalicica]SMX26593.1 FAD-dependent urate hydroxylase [Pelagimonas phthalicica]